MESIPLICIDRESLFCPSGGFYMDSKHPIKINVVSHAHGDHFGEGCDLYICTKPTAALLKVRLGSGINVMAYDYYESFDINGVKLSFHPSGHILGAAQIRLEANENVWVYTGDCKEMQDGFNHPMQSLRCDYYLTESTFGLPQFKWPTPQEVCEDILKWIEIKQKEGRVPILVAYALGKAQLIQHLLASKTNGFLLYRGIKKYNEIYNKFGFSLPASDYIKDGMSIEKLGAKVNIIPPHLLKTKWMLRYKDYQCLAYVSGWSQESEKKMHLGIDRYFCLSDHSDYDGLCKMIHLSKAKEILLHHGFTKEFSMDLRSKGYRVEDLRTYKAI